MLTELTDVELKPNLLSDCEEFLKKKKKSEQTRRWMVNGKWWVAELPAHFA